MCGRLDLNDISRLIQDFSWADELVTDSRTEGLYNVAPGTLAPLLTTQHAALTLEDRHWGYQSSWAQASKKVPMAINTKLEKIANSYWRPLLTRGRALVAANGWYEWTGEKGEKQPWHIHRSDGELLYLAALCGRVEAAAEAERAGRLLSGFTIITADAEGGLLDVHDRRPVVLSKDDARTWIDLDLDGQEAAEFIRNVALPAERFEWFAVDKALGNVRNQGAHLAQRKS